MGAALLPVPGKKMGAAPAAAAGRHVGKICAELLPAYGDEIGADEGQQRVTAPRAAAAE